MSQKDIGNKIPIYKLKAGKEVEDYYDEWTIENKYDKDMAEINLPYNPVFWKNLSLPPDTAFYKKIKAELESNFGVPLETQFKVVNN